MPVLHRCGISSLSIKIKGSFYQYPWIITFIMKRLCVPSGHTLQAWQDNVYSIFSRLAGKTDLERRTFHEAEAKRIWENHSHTLINDRLSIAAHPKDCIKVHIQLILPHPCHDMQRVNRRCFLRHWLKKVVGDYVDQTFTCFRSDFVWSLR